MVKDTSTIRRKIADHLNVFDHFVGLSLKGLKNLEFNSIGVALVTSTEKGISLIKLSVFIF